MQSLTTTASSMEGAMAAATAGVGAHAVMSWDQLPLDVQQRILVLSANTCLRRVCKAIRDAFDAVNQTLHAARSSPIATIDDEQAQRRAQAAVLRMVQRCPSLTAVSLPSSDHVSLSSLTVADAGLATRLRKVTGLFPDVGDPLHHLAQLQALQQCTGLVHLDISSRWPHHKAQGEAAALASALQGLPHLTYLGANACRFSSELVPALVSARQTLTRLQSLHMAASALTPRHLLDLAPTLSAMPGLHTLDISDNSCHGLQGAQALCEVLRSAPGLTHLDVGGNFLQQEGAAILAPVLRRVVSLQHLQLKNTGLGDAGLAMLAPALAALPRLHSLGLASNNLNQGSVPALQPLLAKQCGTLRTFDLSQTMLGTEGAQALSAALISASDLQSLNIGLARMEGEGLVVLAPALCALGPSLHTLQLWGGSLDLAGASAFASALQALTGLTCFHLSCNLQAQGAALVAPALSGMRRLQELDLSYSYFGPNGAAALAQVLPALAGTLQCLSLSGCDFGAEGMVALAPALAQTTGLINLSLRDNDVRPETANALAVLASAFQSLRVLRVVDLLHNPLGSAACAQVADALRGRDYLPIIRFHIIAEEDEGQLLELDRIDDVLVEY